MASTAAPTIQGIHFVGSIPYPDAATVFNKCGTQLGARLRRLPDGEPGDRQGWISFQRKPFEKYPKSLIPIGYDWPAGHDATDAEIATAIADLTPLNTEYDTHAIESYKVFKAARDAGHVAPNTKFQVSLPTVLAFVGPMVARRWQSAVEPLYEDGLFRAVKNIQAQIPHQDLSIQFDFCIELNVLDAKMLQVWYDDLYEGTLSRAARCLNLVEPDVDLGLHFCYGDLNHKHWKEPENLAWVNTCAMEMKKRVHRPIDFMQMPVPRSRDDAAFFAPLKELIDNQGETEIYLGLIHPNDVDGTRRRIEAAGKTVPKFGVATECGMGRTPEGDIASIMQTSRDVAQPWE